MARSGGTLIWKVNRDLSGSLEASRQGESLNFESVFVFTQDKVMQISSASDTDTEVFRLRTCKQYF